MQEQKLELERQIEEKQRKKAEQKRAQFEQDMRDEQRFRAEVEQMQRITSPRADQSQIIKKKYLNQEEPPKITQVDDDQTERYMTQKERNIRHARNSQEPHSNQSHILPSMIEDERPLPTQKQAHETLNFVAPKKKIEVAIENTDPTFPDQTTTIPRPQPRV